MPLRQALEIAREHDIDLVEVAPTAVPPVCRLLDYGKFKYEQAKKEREARKGQKSALLRQVRLRPKIGEHDIDIKTRLIKKLLDEGDKVKVLVMFRAREITHPHLGKELLDKISDVLKEAASVEKPLAMEGRNMSIIFAPSTKQTEQKHKNKEP
jgi:translation initiation factor IF-3